MKRVSIILSVQQLESMLNDKNIEVIKLDVKATENTYATQECFIAVMVYEERSA